MTSLPRVEFDSKDAQIDLTNQSQCMKFIREQVIPSLFDDCKTLGVDDIDFRKITKNDNIQQTLDKLMKLSSQFIALYSYGPHIQKMLSILEIYKKISKKDGSSNIRLRQWNKLSCFVSIQAGRNELLEKRTRVPIFISIMETPSSTGKPIDLDLKRKGMTEQF